MSDTQYNALRSQSEFPLFDFFESLDRLSEYYMNILRADWGITSRHILSLPAGDMRMAKVSICDGRFEFDENGEWAYIIVADLSAKDAIDLVAISCKRPTRFGSLLGWHWCGASEFMRRTGSEWPEIFPRNINAENGWTDQPLLLNWHPLEMIAHGCIGATPISQSAVIDVRSICEGIALVFCDRMFLNIFMARFKESWPHTVPETRLLNRRAA